MSVNDYFNKSCLTCESYYSEASCRYCSSKEMYYPSSDAIEDKLKSLQPEIDDLAYALGEMIKQVATTGIDDEFIDCALSCLERAIPVWEKYYDNKGYNSKKRGER